MLRDAVSLFLCVVIPLQTVGARPGSPPVQEVLGRIPAGAIIVVKTTSEDLKTVRGRLGAVTSEGFEVQTTQGAKIDTVKINFSDVKSVKERGKGLHPVVWVLAGVGIAFTVLLAIAYAAWDD